MAIENPEVRFSINSLMSYTETYSSMYSYDAGEIRFFDVRQIVGF
jgi:hypothetical protein